MSNARTATKRPATFTNVTCGWIGHRHSRWTRRTAPRARCPAGPPSPQPGPPTSGRRTHKAGVVAFVVLLAHLHVYRGPTTASACIVRAGRLIYTYRGPTFGAACIVRAVRLIYTYRGPTFGAACIARADDEAHVGVCVCEWIVHADASERTYSILPPLVGFSNGPFCRAWASELELAATYWFIELFFC